VFQTGRPLIAENPFRGGPDLVYGLARLALRWFGEAPDENIEFRLRPGGQV
jgi:hypothetical protein